MPTHDLVECGSVFANKAELDNAGKYDLVECERVFANKTEFEDALGSAAIAHDINFYRKCFEATGGPSVPFLTTSGRYIKARICGPDTSDLISVSA